MPDLDRLLEAFGAAGGDLAVLSDTHTAHIVAMGHSVSSARSIPGVEIRADRTRNGIRAGITVSDGVRVERPVHICAGVMSHHGTQRIEMEVTLGRDSRASFVAHCIFPEAVTVRHLMRGRFDIGEGAMMQYRETHFHGPHGGVTAIPKMTARLARGSRFQSDFLLVTGHVGVLDIDYDILGGEDSTAELTARIFAHGDDRVRIREKITLAGANARGLIKTRLALEGNSSGEVTGITEGNAPGARGHIDCMELVRDHATARAVPVVNVTHPQAKVTHEAAIGSVDRHQMETLMAHGLSPDESVDVIVRGILG